MDVAARVAEIGKALRGDGADDTIHLDARIGLEGTGMPTFGLAEHRPDQPVEQIDGLVGQVDAEIQTDGDQRCMPALAFVAGDVLHRCPVGLAREPCQARLVDQMAAATPSRTMRNPTITTIGLISGLP